MNPGSTSSPLRTAPPGARLGLEDEDVQPGVGEDVGADQPVRARPDDDGVGHEWVGRLPVAINEIHIDRPPERVFAVLADWRSYGDWVVGSRFMRGADPGFPAAGTRFHHQVGVGPLHLNDHTKVLEVDQPRKLILKAKARPLGTAIVDITIEPGRRHAGHAARGPGRHAHRLRLQPAHPPARARPQRGVARPAQEAGRGPPGHRQGRPVPRGKVEE